MRSVRNGAKQLCLPPGSSCPQARCVWQLEDGSHLVFISTAGESCQQHWRWGVLGRPNSNLAAGRGVNQSVPWAGLFPAVSNTISIFVLLFLWGRVKACRALDIPAQDPLWE